MQSFAEHCFTENHGHSRASNIPIVSCVFLMGYNIYFFYLGFVSKKLTNRRTAVKGRGYFFRLLSTTSTHFSNRLVFSVCSYRRGLMMNEDIASGSRNRTTFFCIKTSIRVNKGTGFLDLLFNISFHP